MRLIEQVRVICNRLAPLGWRDLLMQHGLDITATDLERELIKELPSINRRVPGFEDFAIEGRRGIQAGNPARSLLFHALACCNVTTVAGRLLQGFPTLAEIDVVENYIYGVQAPSVRELRARAGRQPLAIVVFANEYRPAPETVHRKHADMCFSRTGVARVGTAQPKYDASKRGFIPFVEGEPNSFRVLPARYSAYVAVQSRGNQDAFGPMRSQQGDSGLNFWVPLHKLFAGDECIRGLDLQVNFDTHHVNEKLRRIHLVLKNAGWGQPDINNPPFIFTEGIAELATNLNFGAGLLLPVVHPNLVEAATYKGKPLTYKVQPTDDVLSSSIMIPAMGEGGQYRSAPEYVHARHRVLANGQIQNLNDLPNVVETVKKGGYDALHYIDFTGDGWVEALCPQLAVDIPRNIPAYSLVTAPDFFPNCDQGELLDWTQQSVPSAIRQGLWRIPPESLSDDRIAANIQIQGANFRAEDKTVTAIISLPLHRPEVRQTSLNVRPTMRHTHLPDGAAGFFAPGWDVSIDRSGNVEHLAAYGLGSPFPEDSKLCAALSTFWPAVAPDTARTYVPKLDWPTVSPLTDEEIGQSGNLPWDGIQGPKVVSNNGKVVIEYADYDHTDYVENTLNNKFSLSLTGKVDVSEYQARVLAMANVYRMFNATTRQQKANIGVLSFRAITIADAELQQAQTQTRTTLQGKIYRFEVYLRNGKQPKLLPGNPRKSTLEVDEVTTLYISPINVLVKQRNGTWVSRRV
ncbi:hypothetical protein DSM106972_056680 [Dulcicalothrix desertica PCC 7102]|uniref:Uncharacterized protein n=1 Tax=Dulcicalothrix desertica PCC 7102 TaxID=232991 RepID=A0A3S1CG04_9CYAN|nr:hypothetical protein [Dulcicalothrix desertica]RUT02748.1 hypothetical protein DSM106972_056680 [Dulcicalothrix desertica PCC 7102]TWH39017.1 hypothetical protein CAL7102_08220 [Dulcicalothrix desertica PCC 7102]